MTYDCSVGEAVLIDSKCLFAVLRGGGRWNEVGWDKRSGMRKKQDIFLMDCPHCGKGIYKPDNRGAPVRVSTEEMLATLKKHKTQKEAAKALNMTPRRIQQRLKDIREAA